VPNFEVILLSNQYHFFYKERNLDTKTANDFGEEMTVSVAGCRASCVEWVP